jgi:uncharacterized protein YndB with AHSA1/START domain
MDNSTVEDYPGRLSQDMREYNTVDVSIVVARPPAVVWQALTDASELSRWWPGMHIEAHPGGQIRETWASDEGEFESQGRVIALRPPEYLSFEWCDPDWKGPTTVTLRIRASAPANSAIEASEAGFEGLEGGGDIASQHERGWQHHLVSLQRYLATR